MKQTNAIIIMCECIWKEKWGLCAIMAIWQKSEGKEADTCQQYIIV